MLRVTIHSGMPSEASRFNRTDWIDIGYDNLAPHADYKVMLFLTGYGALRPVRLLGYPRWSASLWDLTARAIAASLWGKGPGTSEGGATADSPSPPPDAPNQTEATASTKPGKPEIPEPTPLLAVDAGEVYVPPAEIVPGKPFAFAERTCALITHLPNSGSESRLLGTLVIAHDKRAKCTYGIGVDEDPKFERKIVPRFMFWPQYLQPAELVLRACLQILSGDIDRMPPRPSLALPKAEMIRGKRMVSIRRLEEPARTGFLRWLRRKNQAPKPEPDAVLGRAPESAFLEFLKEAV